MLHIGLSLAISMTSNGFSETFVLEPTSSHTHTIILLHGLGSNGQDFASELFESQDSSGRTLDEIFPGYRWVFPSAKSSFSEKFQEHMNQWYEIGMPSGYRPEEEKHDLISDVRESMTFLDSIIARERVGAPSGKVILCGISQGFSIAVLTAIADSSELEALVGFSSWLLYSTDFMTTITSNENAGRVTIRSAVGEQLLEILRMERSQHAAHPAIPIYLGHCADDETVDVELGRSLRNVIVSLGHDTTWMETNGGGHWLNEPDGIDALVAFLQQHDLS